MKKGTTIQDVISSVLNNFEKNDMEPKYQRVSYMTEQQYISNIERHLGFSLNDDDASKKLLILSDTIQIPNILYHYVT